MPAQFVTTEDLHELKRELLIEIKQLLKSKPTKPEKKWLKSYEIQEKLSISTATLQALRNRGEIPCTKIGGVFFYDYEELNRVLSEKCQRKD